MRLDKQILEDYRTAMLRLDRVMEDTTRYFCANCGPSPVGCCHGPETFKKGFSRNREFLEAQEQEARENGWTRPHFDSCRYFIDGEGCPLSGFRVPYCAGYVCEKTKAPLRSLYSGSEELEEFLAAMDLVFVNDSPRSRAEFKNLIQLIHDAADRGEEFSDILVPGHAERLRQEKHAVFPFL